MLFVVLQRVPVNDSHDYLSSIEVDQRKGVNNENGTIDTISISSSTSLGWARLPSIYTTALYERSWLLQY